MKTQEERLNFYKELYYKEVDRRKDFNNAIIIPITLLTGVFSILFYLISAYKFTKWEILEVLYIISFTFSLVLFLICAFYTIKFYSNIDKGYNTIELPSADGIEKYRIDLYNFHKEEKDAENNFINWLTQQYILSTINYQNNNDLKNLHFFKFKKFFLYGLMAVFISGILFIQNFMIHKEEKQEMLNIHIEINSNIPSIGIIKIDSLLNKSSLSNDSLKLKINSNGRK